MSTISLSSITSQLNRQYEIQLEALRIAEEKGASETITEARLALHETRKLLARFDHEPVADRTISCSVPFPLNEANDLQEPSIASKLARDIQNLSLQLRCNLVTEDRPHMGRIYLQSFVGEDAMSWLEKRAETDRLELLGKSSIDDSLRESPKSTPASSPSSSRSASPSPSQSPRQSPRGSRRRRSALGIGRMEAVWVANELVRSGEWQQLTGTAPGSEKRVEKSATSLVEAASSNPSGNGLLNQTGSTSCVYTSPTGRGFHPHSSLLQFTLFRMRTWPALNEKYRWECSSAREAGSVTCHLLALVSELELDELSESLLSSLPFQRFERATAELQRVEYTGLGSAGLTSFLVNLHNVMVHSASHCPHKLTNFLFCML